jgi:cytokinesis protein
MDTFFGRKKSRPRQSSLSGRDLSEHSVPYDKLAPAPRAPMPVGTVSQGLRGTSVISAPLTNPTLTHDGTELNYNSFAAYQRNRIDRDRANTVTSSSRPESSFSTGDSSTLYNESMVSFTPSKRPKTPTHKLRKSEASGASGRRSPNGSDYGSTPFPTSPASSLRPGTGTPLSSESERTSRFSSSETHASHLSHLFHKPHSTHEEFDFPRPARDEDIEALFDYVSMTRDLPPVNNLTIEKKWQLVYGAEQLRWQEEKNQEEHARKQGDSSTIGSLGEGTPDYYIRRFLDNTITPKQASSVWVSLKSHETR